MVVIPESNENSIYLYFNTQFQIEGEGLVGLVEEVTNMYGFFQLCLSNLKLLHLSLHTILWVDMIFTQKKR